jgi:hypothetical protein
MAGTGSGASAHWTADVIKIDITQKATAGWFMVPSSNV